MSRTWPGVTAIVVTAVLAALAAAAIATAADTRAVSFSSDILLPVDFIHNLVDWPGTVRTYELPRIPSLFPDMAVMLVLWLVLPAWRLTAIVYPALSFAALVLMGSAITGRLAGRPFGRAAAVFGAFATIALLADMQFDQGLSAFYLILYPAIHSGSLLCTLGGLLLVRSYVGMPGLGRGVSIGVLAAMATVSDRLFIASFVVPAAAATLAAGPSIGRLRELPWRRALIVAGITVAGCAVGIGLDRLLFHGLLLRQPDLSIKLPLQWARLPALLRDNYLYIVLACAVATAAVPAAWALRSAETRFWWVAGAAVAAAMTGALPLVYIDWTSYRYVQPVCWWAVIVLAAALVRFAPRTGAAASLLAAGAAVVAAFSVRGDLFDIRSVTAWRHPGEACLAALRDTGRVHAALAGYWLARPIAASSNWTLPVAQVGANGKPLLWGNNRADYRQDAAGAPPRFDAVVADQLDPASILARFGAPDDRVDCAHMQFWTYADPGHLRSRLAGTDTRLGGADGPVWFGPSDLASHTGPLPPDGLVPAETGPGPASWGPFAALQPGAWRMVLRYSFAGAPNARAWEVRAGSRQPTLASGPLEAGTDRILSVRFDAPPGRQVELYTHVVPGDRLALAGLGLCPAGMPEADCVRATIGER